MSHKAAEGDLQMKYEFQLSAANHHRTQSLLTSQAIYPHIKDKLDFLTFRGLWDEPSPGTF